MISSYLFSFLKLQAVALRARHMYELAMLNGTLKEIDLKCLNCGKFGHKSWECDERPNFTSSVICSACGGVGHLSSYSFFIAPVCQLIKSIAFYCTLQTPAAGEVRFTV